MTRRGSNRKVRRNLTDVTAPVISGLAAAGVTSTAATINFSTDEGAITQLQYDTNSGFTAPVTVSSSGLYKTSHSYGLTGLALNTTYYFRARATDISTNQSDWTDTANFVTTGGGDAWVDSGSVANVTIGTMTLDATFESIAIEVLFSESVANTLTSATVEYRTSPDGTVYNARPLWIIRPLTGSAGAYGKIRLRTHNTAYDVRVTLNGTATKSGTITTRNDNLTPASSLTPTHYLSPTGNDTTGNGSSDAPWRTISKAVTTASAGSVIQLAAGWYARYGTIITKSLTFKAAAPVIDDNLDTINAGNHAVIFEAQAGPTGAADAHLTAVAPWTLHNATYNIYKWAAGTALANVCHCSVHATLEGTPARVVYWKRSGDALTYALWETLVTTNLSYNYGMWVDTNGDIYLRIPPENSPGGEINPNNLYVTVGGNRSSLNEGFGLCLNASNCRVTGIVFHTLNTGVLMRSSTSNCHIDHVRSYTTPNIVSMIGAANGGTNSTYGADNVIEYFDVIDSGMWTYPSPTKENTIPWTLIKGNIVKAGGTTASPNRMAEACEGHGVDARGGARRTVVRYGRVDGCFNGFGGNSSGYDRYANYGLDLHDCTVRHAADEAIEFETNAICIAWWNMRVEHCKQGFSTSPLNYGPQYGFNSTFWRVGAHGQVAWPTGSSATPGSGGFHKYTPPANDVRSRIYLENITIWTDTVTPMGLGPHGRGSAGGAVNAHVVETNCIMRAAGRIVEWETSLSMIFPDNSLYATGNDSGVNEGWKYSGTTYRTQADVATWRAAINTQTGVNPANAQKLNGVDIAFNDAATVDALFTDPENGDLTLAAGTNYAVDAGAILPELHDGANYNGSAPDLGGAERS